MKRWTSAVANSFLAPYGLDVFENSTVSAANTTGAIHEKAKQAATSVLLACSDKDRYVSHKVCPDWTVPLHVRQPCGGACSAIHLRSTPVPTTVSRALFLSHLTARLAWHMVDIAHDIGLAVLLCRPYPILTGTVCNNITDDGWPTYPLEVSQQRSWPNKVDMFEVT